MVQVPKKKTEGRFSLYLELFTMKGDQPHTQAFTRKPKASRSGPEGPAPCITMSSVGLNTMPRDLASASNKASIKHLGWLRRGKQERQHQKKPGLHLHEEDLCPKSPNSSCLLLY